MGTDYTSVPILHLEDTMSNKNDKKNFKPWRNRQRKMAKVETMISKNADNPEFVKEMISALYDTGKIRR